jgi:hypothetical protein
MKRPWSLHRLPALFLAVGIIALLAWTYWRFVHVSTISVALPDRDAEMLRAKISSKKGIKFRRVTVPGSREGAALVAVGKVDLAFVQGGIPLAPDLARLEIPSPEVVLWLTRPGIAGLNSVRTILTSAQGEGSHTVAEDFVKAWSIQEQVTFRHDWQSLTSNETYTVPAEVDAVFVVKDPADEKTLTALKRLAASGFELRSPDIGVRATKLAYVKVATLPPRYLATEPAFPPAAVKSYNVATFLVARPGLTPRLLGVAAHVFDDQPANIADGQFSPSASEASEMFQGIEAFLGIIVNLGLAFLALLGLEIMTYRKRFHELNSLVSLLSMLQSNKDVLSEHDGALKRERLLYLGLCSDLFGLVSMISGYYTQENSSLLFNNLSEVIHQRCESLKINIQLKILHALIHLPPLKEPVIQGPTIIQPRESPLPLPPGENGGAAVS